MCVLLMIIAEHVIVKTDLHQMPNAHPTDTHPQAEDRQPLLLLFFFSNWKMTAALSYKAIKSTYIGEHSL